MIAADLCGASAGESTTTVSARRSMAYAAAIGADDACYADDLRPGGIVAPPPFCVSLEWPVVSGWWCRLGGFATPEDAWGSVHVLQDSRFHRPIVVGRTLRTRGRFAAVRPTSAGAYVAIRLDTDDVESGERVVTSFWGGIFYGVEVGGEGRVAEEAEALRVEASTPEGAARVEIAVDRLFPHRYSECAQIWNPIHTERAAARARGLDDIILHGSATWAMAAHHLVRIYANGDPRRLRRVAARFKGMVIPGQPIVLEHDRPPSAKATAFAVRNARGELAITHGIAELD